MFFFFFDDLWEHQRVVTHKLRTSCLHLLTSRMPSGAPQREQVFAFPARWPTTCSALKDHCRGLERWFRGLERAALPENPSSILSTHMRQTACNSSSREADAVWHLWALAHACHTLTQAHTCTHKEYHLPLDNRVLRMRAHSTVATRKAKTRKESLCLLYSQRPNCPRRTAMDF